MKKRSAILAILLSAAGLVPFAGLGYYIYQRSEKMDALQEEKAAEADKALQSIIEQTGVSPSPDIVILDDTDALSDGSGVSPDGSDGMPDGSGVMPDDAENDVKSDISENTSEKTVPEEITESAKNAAGDSASGNAPVSMSIDKLPPEYVPPLPASDHRVIFVGDSRTVGMGKAEVKLHGDNCIYIGESGEGYNWFIEFGLDQLEDAIRENPKLPVIFNLGVNDCDAISSYIEVYHLLLEEHPDTTFRFMSVNPVTEESPHVPNSDVLDFNAVLSAEFPEQYIDTCSWMMRDGFDDVDSIHYTEEQYCLIHDFAVEAVR